jgi:hypothetical protein
MTADDWVKIISAIASGLVLILGAIAALWLKVHGYRSEVNGRMDQLLELTRSSAIAQGRLAHSIEQGLTPPPS